MRLSSNLERLQLAKILNLNLDTIEGWELYNIMPRPENLLKLSNYFNKEISYFHDYYRIYYSNYSENIMKWKNNNKYSYLDIAKILNISRSSVIRLINGTFSLSYEMYLKLKKEKII